MGDTERDGGDLTGFLAGADLFPGFEAPVYEALATELEARTVAAGEAVFSAGDPVDGVYLVRRGRLTAALPNKDGGHDYIHTEPGQSVGVIQRFRDARRSATVTAAEDSEVLLMTPAAFDRLMERFPDAFGRVAQLMSDRVQRIHFGVILRLNPLFRDLDEAILRAVEQRVELVTVPSGQLLCRQGDESDALFVVISGRLRIWKQNSGPGASVFLNEVGQGGSVGEMGVVTGSPRAADVKAIRDTTVGRLSRDALQDLLRRHPEELNKLFMRMVMQHFGSDAGAAAKPKNSTNTFALIPIDGDVPIGDVGRWLGAAMARVGTTFVLDSEGCDAQFDARRASQTGFEESLNAPLLDWLNQQEFAHDFTLYVGDGTFSNWTRRCVRQADHVLFVAQSKTAPAIGPIEAQVIEAENVLGLRKSLVLLHEPGIDVPSGTLAWLNARKIGMHQHVRKGDATDFGRLARFLTGHAVALVLGGGGARGFAHVGVLRAMRKLDIPIDLVAGTSMGAMIASQCAMQMDPDTILKNTLDLCLAGEELTIPVVSLFAGAKMTRGVRKMMHGVEIEDLWRRFFCVSCNLSRADIVVHDKGPLHEAVLASNTPPGLFPPKVHNGDLLVDGCLLNNLPADVMQRYNEGGEMIAVDVNPKDDLLANTPYDGGLSGFKVLTSKFNPFAETINVPNIVDIITRSTNIGGLAHMQRVMQGIADVYLQPPVSKYAIMAYGEAEEIAQVGYDCAMRGFETWLEERKRRRDEAA
ncbi:MAG: cyclic nucleotide-binding domain-containing protein [Hyphomicrobiales bacterium]|nr:cyclic nucleotide-binding domain-containing protein [Hyphomicrobiales bacterium]